MRVAAPKPLPAVVLLLAAFLLACEGTPEIDNLPPTGVLTSTGRLNTPRADHRATLLPDGRVLITGGMTRKEKALASAELYDPATGTFTLTAGLSVPRTAHTATLLPDGRVLIVGGGDGAHSHASAELYDPATETFTPTGSLNAPRAAHTATLLPNGQVLITGGAHPQEVLATAELYDPATGTFQPAGMMSARRWSHTATLLPDGTVLIAGGGDGHDVLPSADLYDPTTGRFTPVGRMTEPRYKHTATLLRDGRVLLAGGAKSIPTSKNYRDDPLASAELYDPSTRSFKTTGRMISPRHQHAAARLESGEVLVAGFTAEVYEPTSGRFHPVAGNLGVARSFAQATLLKTGKVLLSGGLDPVTHIEQSLAEGKREIIVLTVENAEEAIRWHTDPRRREWRATAHLYRPCGREARNAPPLDHIDRIGDGKTSRSLADVKAVYVWHVQEKFAPFLLPAFGAWAESKGIQIACTLEEADAILLSSAYPFAQPTGVAGNSYDAYSNTSPQYVSAAGGKARLIEIATGGTIWDASETYVSGFAWAAGTGIDPFEMSGVARLLVDQLEKNWQETIKNREQE